MPEHTIPSSLLEHIRTGRAALVVGAGIGASSWKQLLERMNERLVERGNPGDDEAARDVEKLLHKGNLTRAAGFLARTLGEQICDEIVIEAWGESHDQPELAKALARLPFRQIWTTFPGDVIERAVDAESPEDWPELRSQTYQEVAAVNRRRRTLLKILGDFNSYVVTPTSVRKALTSAEELREYVRDFYADGSLIFVGFRFGDPDLAALLDRVFGQFEPPEREHYMLAAGAGPVTVEELMSEHHIEVINLAGKGADEEASAALLEWLGELESQCTAEGISLAQERPDADDVEGWLTLLAADNLDADALDAIARIEAKAEKDGDGERLIETLLGKVEIETAGAARAATLRRVANTFETMLGDIPSALTTLTAALREEPANTDSLDQAERLAGEADGWSELVAEVSELAGELEDRQLAAEYWTRIGSWYHQKLHHLDYAVASYREATKKNLMATEAHDGLAKIFRAEQRWGDLAEQLSAHLDVETDLDKQVELNLAIGELNETQLASTSKAIEAYELAAELNEDCDDAWRALERLHRGAEAWSKLAQILDARSRLFERAGDSARATAIQGELSQLRADKLGDIDASIRKLEAALDSTPDSADTLRQLAEMYDKAGRSADQLDALSRLVDVVPNDEKRSVLSQLARASEKRSDDPQAAITAYRKLVEVAPSNDAHAGLARALREAGEWSELTSAILEHSDSVSAPAERAELFANLADVYEEHLDEPHKAIDAHLRATGEVDAFSRSLTGLARLYQATENWDRALNITVAHAESQGSADLWREAGTLAGERLQRLDQAKEYFERALSSDKGHLPTLLALANLHKDHGQYRDAAMRLLEAEAYSQDRDQRVSLLFKAASLYEEKEKDLRRGLTIFKKILELDPEHSGALERAASILASENRWKEAADLRANLAADISVDDSVRARRLASLGHALVELGQYEDAVAKYDLALTTDAENLDVAFAAVEAKIALAENGEDKANWAAVNTLCQDLANRFAEGLSADQAASLWHSIGVSALKSGDDSAAEAAFRRSLGRNPHYVPSLSGLIDVSAARGDYETVVQAKRDLLKDAEGEDKAALYEDIGDVYAEHLGDKDRAMASYLEARKLKSGSHVLLHKMLEIYGEKKQWRHAIEMLDALAGTAKAPVRRAKYHYAAAVIARDELKDNALSLEKFSASLVDDPENQKAFEALDGLYSETGDYKGLARAYRKMLKRLGDEAEPERAVALWARLGEIYLDHLGDSNNAMAALEVAAALDPTDMERHETLVNLYLEAGEEKHAEAIEELQILIRHEPDRVELYHALYALYESIGDVDRSFCVAQALVFLGAASDAQKACYGQYRPKGFTTAKRKLTEELWQKAIIHERENRHLNAIFSSMVGALASTTARPAADYNLNATERADLNTDSQAVSKIFKYSSEVLALDPQPNLYVRGTGDDALQVANTAEGGRLIPAMLAAGSHATKGDPRELAFELGKRLAYFRPERFVNFALGGLPQVEQAYAATLAATGAPGAEEADGEAVALAGKLRQLVPSPVLEQVGAVARELSADSDNGVVAGWRSATDLTANRVGLILCNDLTTAARLIAKESSPMSTMSAKDRLRDLIAYSASEGYFAVRRHLGLTVA